ncbi:hypothetical protein F5B19DRAFT_132468 [Rostrohypoxylon terebratum]|nr:hypothetical protein F5B19DRAFT_132468 [Rostrohypoxylon terebratum]
MSAGEYELTADQEATFYDDRGPRVIAVESLFIGLNTIAVSLRFASRFSRTTRLVDDWLSVAALICITSYSICDILVIHDGVGRHWWTIPDDEWLRMFLIEFSSGLVVPIARCLVKLALLFLYRRVFTMNVKWFRYMWYILTFYVIGYGIVGVFTEAFQCSPPSYYWEEANFELDPPAQGSCKISGSTLSVVSTGLAITSEVALFVMPIISLSQLHLKLPQKIGLMAIFGTGIVAIGAECVKLWFTLYIARPDVDANFFLADQYLWTVIQDSLGLICACLPTCGPIMVATRNAISFYVSRFPAFGSARSSSEASPVQSSAQWNLITIGAINRRTAAPDMSMTRSSSQDQQGIWRTDEYSLDTHPRTDGLPLYDYHDPTKPAGSGSVV